MLSRFIERETIFVQFHIQIEINLFLFFFFYRNRFEFMSNNLEERCIANGIRKVKLDNLDKSSSISRANCIHAFACYGNLG